MPGRIDLDVALGAAGKNRGERRSQGARRRILVLGDVGGRGQRAADDVASLANRPVPRLDLDSFDAVLAALAPALRLAAREDDGQPPALRFRSLDDFHPDHLCRQVEALHRDCESRSRLLDPATFEAEAARLLADHAVPTTIAEGGTTDAPTTAPAPAGTLLEQLLGGPAAVPTTAGAKSSSIVDALVRKAVGASDAQAGGGRSPAPYVAALEAKMSQTLRTVLHDPGMQALEGAWRGLRRFVEGVDLDDTGVELYVLDVTKAELLADAAAHAGNVAESALLACLRRRGAALTDDRRPWSLLVGHFEFGAEPVDLALLAHLGAVAAQIEAPMLGTAHPALAGAASAAGLSEPAGATAPAAGDVQRLWSTLRRSPVAPWLGLTLPRLLLRQPYGPRSDAIDTFAFEEVGPDGTHERYLWGSSALACAQSLAAAFAADGDEVDPGSAFDVDDLPVVVRDTHGERTLLPCAEVRLSAQAAEVLRERGFVALLSYPNRNAVRVPGLQSIAEPARPLAGLG